MAPPTVQHQHFEESRQAFEQEVQQQFHNFHDLHRHDFEACSQVLHETQEAIQALKQQQLDIGEHLQQLAITREQQLEQQAARKRSLSEGELEMKKVGRHDRQSHPHT